MKVTYELVKELLDYNPTTGDLIWKQRDIKYFKSKQPVEWTHKSWNIKNAGKPALTTKHITNKDGRELINGLHGPILGKTYRAHRIIWLWMTGEWPKEVIDHINGDSTDNRWENLRSVSIQINAKNKKNRFNSRSGYPGVNWHVTFKKWQVQSTSEEGKSIYRGLFDDLEEAIAVSKSFRTEENGYHENHGRIVD